ncbi:CLIP-associating protein [Scaptodrosophila lebanonensis]|uniref:CLIP-associating protein n=1 Tax=Drosophila lebanonensis TaxID=7225 RepID=A0A6J2T4T1_DROLE|nr:CLIP-associating protein [Scaptodrosophila lebanonensis]XP_030371942.1 CLIP-associating protein [Scaptodrosophila lebanonensis]
MAYRKPNDLDGFIALMPKADMRVKVQLAEDLVTFLSDDTNSIVCMDMGFLIDGLMPWLTGSHFKIAQKSLEAFSELIKRLGSDFNAYTATVLPHVIDRLGDNRDTVREKAQLLLRDLMEHRVLTPQGLIDKLAASCFKHKNAKVREEFLQTIVTTLHEYGTQQLSVRNYIPPVAILLGDPTVAVRETAIQTLVEIYKHVGDRLRPDLRKMEDMPASKLALLEQKFDQVKGEGLLLQSAIKCGNGNGNGHDESDNIAVRERPTKIVKRPLHSAASTLRAKPSMNDVSGDAGAVTMEIFEASFELVPQLSVFNSKDMDDVYKQILLVIRDKNADWEKRVDALKKVRALLMLNIQAHPQFLVVQIKELSLAFVDVLKEELRSQVIREACITIAYMSKTLHNKLDTFCLSILEQLIQLIQNSAKVIASASTLALRYIIKYTHAPKLIRIITDTLQQSKSKDIRSALCEILVLLFEEWQTKSLEKHALILRDVLKKSIGDADCDARRHSRCAYWVFRRHFPELADQIYGTLDIAAQRALERERDGGSQLQLETRRTISRIARSPGTLQKPAAGMRSVSAVDTAAAQRAKARAQYTLYSRAKKPLGPSNSTNTAVPPGTGSLPRSRQGSVQPTPSASSNAPTAMPRTRGRSGVSQSQPGSRSTSPSTKLRETYGMSGVGYYRGATGAIPKKASGIPRSTASSRETSPTRLGAGSASGLMKRSLYGTTTGSGTGTRRTPERNNLVRPSAAARMLAQSREAEHTLAGGGDLNASLDGQQPDYVSGDYMRTGGLRIGRKLLGRDESDDIDSEASSVCSERSFDSSYTRGNNSNYSLSGSRTRLDWSSQRAPFDDIETIIQYCASTHWAERKDGLISLTQYLAGGKELTPQQLQCVLDMFRKMFMDTHTKVYSLFLDTVTELILVHAPDLHDWLFILLTRLFNKLGTELLNSMHGKIWKTLQVVNEYFPPELQLKEVFRIISDTTQTPTPKTRIAILRFLTDLAKMYCKSSDFPSDQTTACERTVLKLTQLASDQKSMELRQQARYCLVALYSLNTPQMTKLLAALPKGYQDSARLHIQSQIRRESTNSGTNSPSSSPLSSSSPKPLQSPSVGGPFASLQNHNYNTSPRSRQSSVEQELFYGTELEVQHNIHKTSEEIRHCFGGVAEPLLQPRQYHSLATAPPNGFNGHHSQYHNQQQQQQLSEAQQDSCASLSSNSKTQSSANTTESNTPESATMRLDAQLLGDAANHKSAIKSANSPPPHNSHSTDGSGKVYISFDVAENGELILPNDLRESEIIRVALTLNNEMPVEQILSSLTHLGICIRGGNCELPNKHFRSIMRMLLTMLHSDNTDVLFAGLRVLSKILRSDKMRHNWMNFLELIVLRIVKCYQHSREALREIDAMIPRIAGSLPLDQTIEIVNPVIATGAFPDNLCGIKILLELTERHGSEITDAHLDAVFPNLAHSADNPESMVRKAAVFCIVKLYVVLGEDKVKPKLSVLNPSKVRLLNVYIEKQRNSSGGGSSTKTSSAASSS